MTLETPTLLSDDPIVLSSPSERSMRRRGSSTITWKAEYYIKTLLCVLPATRDVTTQ
jgi:hypothetical protein